MGGVVVRRYTVLVLCLALGVGAAGLARAQSPAPDAGPWRAVPDSVPRHAVQVWAGYSPSSVRLFGKIEGVRLRTIGIRYLRTVALSGTLALEYAADVLPVVAMTYEPVQGAPAAARRRGTFTLGGLGLTPLGMRLRGRRDRRLQPYLEAGAGVAYFPEPLPDRRGERFNLTFRVGVGARVEAGAGVAFSLGYRLHHLSNGFRGDINPGFDSNLFYLGVTLARF